MGKVYAGTSGWAYATWKPDFYPAKLASAKFLGHYASRLNTVEVNYTFRRFPTEKLLRGWLGQVPEDFKFAFKANQKITHIKRLKDVAEFTAEFATALQPMGAEGRLGPVLFQLPPNFKADQEVLGEFLKSLPRTVRAAFEFRHESWLSDTALVEGTCKTLGERNIALCVAETEERDTPDMVTADYAYYRYRKPTYTAAEREKMVTRMKEHLAANRDVFAYFKHEETPEGVLYAVEVLRAVQQ